MPNKQIIRQVSNKVNIIANFAQRRNINGVNYAVYPCILLVEGVHHGVGTDPVYYSQEVLENYASNWNNVPVTIGHPVVDGNHVMCNEDGTVRQQFQVGYATNTRYEDGKLKGDLWINVAEVERKSPGLLSFLESGGELDVSTGLLAGDNGMAGNWNGEEYTAAIQEIIPDHLALLPGATGACSWDDGCGIRVNQGTKKHNPIFCEKNLEKVLQSVHQYVDDLDIYNENQEGGSYEVINFVRAVYEDYFIYERKLRDGSRTLLKQDYTWNENQLNTENSPIEVIEEVSYKTKVNKGEKEMANEKGCCPKKVQALIANENSSFTDSDQEWLEGMNEEQLDKLITNAEPVVEETVVEEEVEQVQNTVSNTIADYLKDAPPSIVSFINEGMKTLDEKRNALINKITNHDSNKFDAKQLSEMETNMLEGIANMIPAPVEEIQPFQDFGLSFPAHVVTNSEEEVEPYIPTTLAGKLGKKD